MRGAEIKTQSAQCILFSNISSKETIIPNALKTLKPDPATQSDSHGLTRNYCCRITLSSRDGELIYAELGEVSDNSANHLPNMGVRDETMEHICSEKCIWAVMAMLTDESLRRFCHY